MSLYSHDAYRPALKWLLAERKRTQPGLTQAKLAEAIGVHSTYITNVFKERAELSTDQLYLIVKFLNLDDTEGEFLALLLEKARTGLADRRKDIQKRIEVIRKQHISPKERLKVKTSTPDDLLQMQFYLDPMVSVIHLALKLPRYRGSLETLAHDLGAPMDKVGSAVQVLEKLKIVEWNAKDQYYLVHQSGSHLAKDHPLCAPHQDLLRMSSAHHISNRRPQIRESFMSTFLADASVVQELYDAFLDFAKIGEKKLVGQSSHDGIYQLNFDLFKWT